MLIPVNNARCQLRKFVHVRRRPVCDIGIGHFAQHQWTTQRRRIYKVELTFLQVTNFNQALTKSFQSNHPSLKTGKLERCRVKVVLR